MKFSFCSYELELKNPLPQAPRGLHAGALIKVEWPQQKLVGYADCHPWPEFGDVGIEQQLQDLAQHRFSTLMEQTLWFAKRDALARAAKVSLFKDHPRIRSHALVIDPLKTSEADLQGFRIAGFSHIKVKMGVNDIIHEVNWLNTALKSVPLKARLDFNSRLSQGDFNFLADSIDKAVRTKIEYVEDPMPYSYELWTKLRTSFPLAIDLEASKVDWTKERLPIDFVVLKPAIQDMDKMSKLALGLRIPLVVTSYMDHPVGQVHALSVAGELKKQFPNMIVDCGLLSHMAYKDNRFSQALHPEGPYVTMNGSGIGFDSMLEGTKWTALS